MSSNSIPQDYLCPITLLPMTDPVICADGHTYERDAIQNWLQLNSTSPMTRQTLYNSTLTPNIALRNIIHDYLAAQSSSSSSSASTSSAAPLFTPVPVDTTATYYPLTKKLHVQITPPSTGQRQPITLFALIDNSGSMGELAGLSDGTEKHGFTRLDLVKHGVNTMANLLNENDSLAIISFSTAARVVMPPTLMNPGGRTKVTAALQTIHPDSQTNIWDAIRVAAQLANRPEMSGRNLVGMLLTDGFPNVNPPRGIIETVKLMEMKNPWTFHTFGFGYQLDSKILQDIAIWGNGLFGFIPDCSMVGTVFINFLANMLATAVPNMLIHVKKEQNGYELFNTGPICLGQQRDYVLDMLTPPVSYSLGNGTTEHPVEINPTDLRLMDPIVETYTDYMKAIDNALIECRQGSFTRAKEILSAFHAAHSHYAEQKIQDLLRDVKSSNESEGQIGMAPSYFQRWGEHYMRSYRTAQGLQVAMNFKDPGLQIYGGDLFHEIQAEGDRIFCDLPAPTPSGAARVAASTSAYSSTLGLSAIPASVPISMSVFHNQSAGCFEENTKVLMGNRLSSKPIKEIQPGELVWCPHTHSAVQVIALVECNSYAKSQPMTQYGSLCITPWHPIHLNDNKWHFPADLASYHSRLISKVFNLVLESGHTIEAEGVECCTLGHGFQEDKVKHDFFGTAAVINDLMKLPGWVNGNPTFKNLVATRDPVTNQINGWVDMVNPS